MNQCKCNLDNDNPDKKIAKEIFDIALKSRNFEIQMFWQRCNYFLILNTAVGVAVAAAVASGKSMYLSPIIPLLCFIGAFVSLAWINVGLGGKFWQSYWEQVLVDFQDDVGLSPSLPPLKDPCKNKDIFSYPEGEDNHIKHRVKKSLHKDDANCLDRLYNHYVLSKPSVTRWMHRTACFFFFVWVISLGFTLCYVFIKGVTP